MYKLSLKKPENFITFLGFTVIWILVGIYVYITDNEHNKLSEILRLNYLIPTTICSTGTVVTCYIFYTFLKKKLAKIISFFISMILGIPIGLLIMILLFRLYVYIRSWIDIIINTR